MFVRGFFVSQKYCADSLSVCVPNPRVYARIRMITYRKLKILWSMSEFGGLPKYENTQHTLIGLGSLTQIRRPEFPERDNKVLQKLN